MRPELQRRSVVRLAATASYSKVIRFHSILRPSDWNGRTEMFWIVGNFFPQLVSLYCVSVWHWIIAEPPVSTTESRQRCFGIWSTRSLSSIGTSSNTWKSWNQMSLQVVVQLQSLVTGLVKGHLQENFIFKEADSIKLGRRTISRSSVTALENYQTSTPSVILYCSNCSTYLHNDHRSDRYTWCRWALIHFPPKKTAPTNSLTRFLNPRSLLRLLEDDITVLLLTSLRLLQHLSTWFYT